MARGPRKSVEEKIEAKEKLIESLKKRMKSEQNELEELYREKREEELAGLNELLKESGLNLKEAADAFREYIAARIEPQQ